VAALTFVIFLYSTSHGIKLIYSICACPAFIKKNALPRY